MATGTREMAAGHIFLLVFVSLCWSIAGFLTFAALYPDLVTWTETRNGTIHVQDSSSFKDFVVGWLTGDFASQSEETSTQADISSIPNFHAIYKRQIRSRFYDDEEDVVFQGYEGSGFPEDSPTPTQVLYFANCTGNNCAGVDIEDIKFNISAEGLVINFLNFTRNCSHSHCSDFMNDTVVEFVNERSNDFARQLNFNVTANLTRFSMNFTGYTYESEMFWNPNGSLESSGSWKIGRSFENGNYDYNISDFDFDFLPESTGFLFNNSKEDLGFEIVEDFPSVNDTAESDALSELRNSKWDLTTFVMDNASFQMLIGNSSSRSDFRKSVDEINSTKYTNSVMTVLENGSTTEKEIKNDSVFPDTSSPSETSSTNTIVPNNTEQLNPTTLTPEQNVTEESSFINQTTTLFSEIFTTTVSEITTLPSPSTEQQTSPTTLPQQNATEEQPSTNRSTTSPPDETTTTVHFLTVNDSGVSTASGRSLENQFGKWSPILTKGYNLSEYRFLPRFGIHNSTWQLELSDTVYNETVNGERSSRALDLSSLSPGQPISVRQLINILSADSKAPTLLSTEQKQAVLSNLPSSISVTEAMKEAILQSHILNFTNAINSLTQSERDLLSLHSKVFDELNRQAGNDKLLIMQPSFAILSASPSASGNVTSGEIPAVTSISNTTEDFPSIAPTANPTRPPSNATEEISNFTTTMTTAGEITTSDVTEESTSMEPGINTEEPFPRNETTVPSSTSEEQALTNQTTTSLPGITSTGSALETTLEPNDTQTLNPPVTLPEQNVTEVSPSTNHTTTSPTLITTTPVLETTMESNSTEQQTPTFTTEQNLTEAPPSSGETTTSPSDISTMTSINQTAASLPDITTTRNLETTLESNNTEQQTPTFTTEQSLTEAPSSSNETTTSLSNIITTPASEISTFESNSTEPQQPPTTTSPPDIITSDTEPTTLEPNNTKQLNPTTSTPEQNVTEGSFINQTTTSFSEIFTTTVSEITTLPSTSTEQQTSPTTLPQQNATEEQPSTNHTTTSPLDETTTMLVSETTSLASTSTEQQTSPTTLPQQNVTEEQPSTNHTTTSPPDETTTMSVSETTSLASTSTEQQTSPTTLPQQNVTEEQPSTSHTTTSPLDETTTISVSETTSLEPTTTEVQTLPSTLPEQNVTENPLTSALPSTNYPSSTNPEQNNTITISPTSNFNITTMPSSEYSTENVYHYKPPYELIPNMAYEENHGYGNTGGDGVYVEHGLPYLDPYGRWQYQEFSPEHDIQYVDHTREIPREVSGYNHADPQEHDHYKVHEQVDPNLQDKYVEDSRSQNAEAQWPTSQGKNRPPVYYHRPEEQHRYREVVEGVNTRPIVFPREEHRYRGNGQPRRKFAGVPHYIRGRPGLSDLQNLAAERVRLELDPERSRTQSSETPDYHFRDDLQMDEAPETNIRTAY